MYHAVIVLCKTVTRLAWLVCDFPPFPFSPITLITLPVPLPFSLSQFILLNWGLKEKWVSDSQSWLTWFFRGSGEQPALVSAQKIHTTKNRFISFYSFAAGGNQADGNEAKSSLHRTPWNSTEGPAPGAPKGKCVARACVCVCLCVHMKPSNYPQGKQITKFVLENIPRYTQPTSQSAVHDIDSV